MPDIKKIKEAVIARHGGFDNASNDQILTLWNSLDEQTKKRYMEISKKGKPDADSTGPKRDI